MTSFNMNYFHIAFHVLNLVNHSNKLYLGVFFSSRLASFIVYYMMSYFYNQHVSIYGVV